MPGGRSSPGWLAIAVAVLLISANSPAQAEQSVTLAWDPSKDTNVENYVVYSGVRSRLHSRATYTAGKTSVTIDGLKEGVTYFFSVAAINLAGLESDPSEEIHYAGPCPGRSMTLTASPVTSPAPGLKLALPAVPGARCRILTSVDLQNWTPAWTSSVALIRTTVEFVDTNSPSAVHRFYRAEITGPYVESANALAVAAVAGSNDVAEVGFTAVAGTAYEVQTSTDGTSWTMVWSGGAGETNRWVEFFDQQTNSVAARRYRLLSAPATAGSRNPFCPDPASQAPAIADIPAQETYDGIPTLAIPVTVSDADTLVAALELSASSSDPSLVPPGQIKFGGAGANRTVTITPVSGRSGVAVIEIFVSDGGNVAATAFELQVGADVPSAFPMALNTRGSGTVQPDLDGQSLTVGKRYTVTAIPGAGQIFVGWTGDLESSSPQLTFVMRPRLTLEAVFALNPFPAIQGTYNGLFNEDGGFRPDRAGSFVATTTGRGTYSGKLRLGGKTYSFSGQMDPERKGTNLLKRTGAGPLTLELSFGGGDSDQANGRVIDGSWQAPLRGYRSVYNARSRPAPFAGSYTVVLPGQISPTPGPEGAGIGVVKIDGNGLARFAGTLADGTKVSLKTALSKDGDWAWYVPLYAKSGAMLGWHTVTLDASNSIRGVLHWAKPSLPKTRQYPGGFTNDLVTTGSRYFRPASSASPVLTFGETDLIVTGGNLSASITCRIALVARNRIANLSDSKLSMTLTPASGMFGGKVAEPSTGKWMSFKGVLLQDRDAGAGFLLGPDKSARVSFGPW